MGCRLYGLSTVVPEHTATQQHSHHFMRRVVEARADEDEVYRAGFFLDAIQEGCGIDRRYSVIEDFSRDDPEEFTFFPKNWALEPFPTTADRMAVYEEQSVELAAEASTKALADAGVAPQEVTHLVVVTCTGSFAPGPDILLVHRLGLPKSTRRTIVGFMGCYGAFNGMRLAQQIMGSSPEAVVLVVCVELCSLHYQNSLDPQMVVGNCLFGDGCAAAVFADERRMEGGYCDLVDSHCGLTDDSLDQMQWHIGDHGFTMVLDVEIPRTLLTQGRAFVDELLHRNGLAIDEVGHWAVHPGGPRIIDAVRDAAGLAEEKMAISRSVLREFGNMSSVTALFVLERTLQRRDGDEPIAMLGFGPGLTMEGAILR